MSALLGAPLPRQDGPAKVTGATRYAADDFAEGMLYGVLVAAPVPAGRLRAIVADAARDIPGVTHVFTRPEMPSLTPRRCPRRPQSGHHSPAGDKSAVRPDPWHKPAR